MFQLRILRASKNSALFLFTLILTVTYRIFTRVSRLVTVHVIVHRKTSIARAAIEQTIFVQESCMIPEILLSVMQFTWQQSRISPTPFPATGGQDFRMSQNSVPSPLSSSKKALISQIEVWSTRKQWSYGTIERSVCKYAVLLAFLKAMHLHIASAVGGPFESKVA